MSKQNILLLLVLLVSMSSCANWAVLVAGSNTWYNYRHQADVFHAYQMVLKKGIPEDNIIVLAYDDIANNTKNPFPGKIFNKPSNAQPGVDVYAGVKIDYKGADVTPTVFLDVLRGKKSAVKGKGTGRVLEATASDNVFIFFSDHGAPNLIAFPSEYLYADKLLATFAQIKGKYNHLTFYLQTCESGSMFVNLSTDTKIYALSAANPTESSWGTYCSPDDVIQGKHIGTCLGDLFSVNFIQESEANDLESVTLQQQFQKIREDTDLSHVMQWGDLSFVGDTVSSIIGGPKCEGQNCQNKNNNRKYFNLRIPFFKRRQSVNFDSRMMKVKILSQVHKRERSEQSLKQLRNQMMEMQRIDNIFHNLAEELNLKGHYSPRHMDYECMRDVMDHHTQKCGRLSDYGLMFAKYYAEACETYAPKRIIENVKC